MNRAFSRQIPRGVVLNHLSRSHVAPPTFSEKLYRPYSDSTHSVFSSLLCNLPRGLKKLFPNGKPKHISDKELGSDSSKDSEKDSEKDKDVDEQYTEFKKRLLPLVEQWNKKIQNARDEAEKRHKNFGGGGGSDNKNNDNKDDKKDDKKKDDKNKEKKEKVFEGYDWQAYVLKPLVLVTGCAIATYTLSHLLGGITSRYNWFDLKEQVINNKVTSITVKNNGITASAQLGEGQVIVVPTGSDRVITEKLEGLQQDMGVPVVDRIPINHVEHSPFLSALGFFLYPIITLAIFYTLSNSMNRGRGGGGGIFRVGQSKHKVASQENLNTKFKDVAGLSEAKEEVEEFVSFLKNPKKYEALGAKIPKGAMLVGPPGTGKTLLAKAIAGESGVPFFSISGSDFVEMFVGVGPSRVRDLFQKARAAAPCIIWIDEIDAVGRARSNSGHGNDERENTLNQILVEMDGFSTQTNVIVLAGTNRVDILDKALLRPGRFDRQISVDAPDIIGRKEIFDVHMKPLKLVAGSEDFSKRLAALTPSMTGADIANVCNEAALIAARLEKDFVEFVDFEAAIERVIAGLEKKSLVLSKDERTRVAYHEAGHAVAGWFLKHAYPLLKVSIIPRGIGALGYAQIQPRDQYLFSVEQLEDQLCTLLAGRAAEQLTFKNISTGARDDLEKATNIIYGQLLKYGMNSSVGTLAFPDESGHLSKFYSENTAKMIDAEARKISAHAYQRTLDLLTEKKELVEKVAQHLLLHEVLRRDEMRELVGPRPWAEVTTYEQMLGEGEVVIEHEEKLGKTPEAVKDLPGAPQA